MTAIILVPVGIVVGALAGLAVRRWIGATARVESFSMEPTFRPGQRLLVRRLRPAERVARGDVVLVRSDEVGRVVVKRAIGLPGERVELDARGRVSIDGHLLAEPYARGASGAAGSDQGAATTTYAVPAGRLWLLGDNRAASSDSRAWRQPYLPEDAVVGKVVRPRRGSRR